MDVTKRAMMNIVGVDLWGGLGRFGSSIANAIKKALTTYGKRRQIQRSRQALLRMDDHMLKDIGITREEAMKEGKRLF